MNQRSGGGHGKQGPKPGQHGSQGGQQPQRGQRAEGQHGRGRNHQGVRADAGQRGAHGGGHGQPRQLGAPRPQDHSGQQGLPGSHAAKAVQGQHGGQARRPAAASAEASKTAEKTAGNPNQSRQKPAGAVVSGAHGIAAMDFGAQARRTLVISRASAGFITRGHPWVRPDRFTRGLEQLRAGEPVILTDAEGRPLAAALADPAGEICARVYHRRADAAFDVGAAVARAWARRAGLHDDPATDCYRVIHGEADFLPGFRVERYAGMLVVVVLAACAMPNVDALCAALAVQMPAAVIVIKDHREDLRRAEVATRVWQAGSVRGDVGAAESASPDVETLVMGRELGVEYPLHPAGGLATGIYVDQRATRTWLRTVVPAGARILNLFAYTGAFSLNLLAHGAASAVDVDLSAPALAAASAAAQHNGLSARHHVRHQDCTRFLREESGQFDVIICDPPTSAQGGEGWILRRDYPDLLKLAAARLASGGLLLAACNTIGGKPFGLVEALRDAVAEFSGESVATPEPGIDIPLMNGFPEGRPFRLAAWRRA